MAQSIVIVNPISDRMAELELALRPTGKSILLFSKFGNMLASEFETVPEAVILHAELPAVSLAEAIRDIHAKFQGVETAILVTGTTEQLSGLATQREVLAKVDDWIEFPLSPVDVQFAIDLLSTTLHEDAFIQRKSSLIERISQDVSGSESVILRQEKEELIRQIYLVLQQQIRHPMLSVMAASEVLKEQINPDVPAYNIACQIEICAKRIRDILETLGNLKTIVIDNYMYGTTMVDFEKSAAQSRSN